MSMLRVIVFAVCSLVLVHSAPSLPSCPVNCTCIHDNPTTYWVNCTQRTKNLESLESEIEHYLSSNDIVNLTINAAHLTNIPTVVCLQTKLQVLDLNFNEINELSINCLRGLHNLVVFHAKSNNVGSLPTGVFDNQYQLKELDLSENKIATIEDGVFSNNSTLGQLVLLNLRYNALKTLDWWPFVRASVQRGVNIDLSHNLISNFTNTITHLKRGACTVRHVSMILNLSFNPIRHVTDIFIGWGFDEIDVWCLFSRASNIWHSQSTLFQPILNGEQFECDCHDYVIAAYTKRLAASFIDSVRCTQPLARSASHLSMLQLNEIVCDLEEHCPSGCQCIQRPWNLTCHVQCHNAGLTRLPTTVPTCPTSYRYKLDFAGNNITNLEYRSYLNKTVILDLRGNPVQHADAATLLAMQYTTQDVYISKSTDLQKTSENTFDTFYSDNKL